jgi:hypothetical protein
VKLWRLRHYVYIPFRFVSWMFKDSELHYKTVWSILVGSAQCDMNWTYTSEEVNEYIDKRIKERK